MLIDFRKGEGSSDQDGGIGRDALLPRTTKRTITTNLKIINKQKCQKINLHGTPTTKKLKKHSPRLIEGTETGNGHPSGEDVWQGFGPCRQGRN